MIHTLQNDRLKLEVSPLYGAGITSFSVLRDSGEWLELMRHTLLEHIKNGKTGNFSSYTLMPYSNRVRGAHFSFAGQEYPLRPNNAEGTARHGDVFARPWTTIMQDGKAASYRIDSRDFDDFNFPFPFVGTVTYRLEGATLMVQLELQNVGDAPMPAGMGIHPYFNRFLPSSREATLEFRASGYYDVPADLMPISGPIPIPQELDFSSARAAGSQKLDTVYAGWDGKARLSWESLGLALELAADPIFSHFVAYTHYDGSLALEPVTHATDGFNLMAQGLENTGVQVLEPGEGMDGTIRMRVKSA